MSFLTLLAVLLLAYYRPLPAALRPAHWHAPLAAWLERHLNDGQARHGAIAWILAVLLPALLIGAACFALHLLAEPVSLALAVASLYLVIDFSGFGAPAENIAATLRDRNIPLARQQLTEWSGDTTEAYGAMELSRVAIETTLLRAHSGLFAPIFWFVLLGPGGALLYRLTQITNTAWGKEGGQFNLVGSRVHYWLEWIPAHVTAIGFAVVGDFEDAMYCWRTQASQWKDRAIGIMLASGAGALGVRLGEPLPINGILEYRPELGLGDAADADYLMSAVGLVWRVLVLLLALVLLMTFANWLGN